MTYPRTRNGWEDKGEVKSTGKCPRCGAPKFVSTVSRDECTGCGYTVDYWNAAGSKPGRISDEEHADREYLIEQDRREQEKRRERESEEY